MKYELSEKERVRIDSIIDRQLYRLARHLFPVHEDIRSTIHLRIEKALVRFKRDNGTSIITYLTWQIKGAIMDFIRESTPASRTHQDKIESGDLPPVKVYPFEPEKYRGSYDPFESVDNLLTIYQLLESDFISGRERQYLQLFLQGYTLKEIGVEIGVTESRCSQMFPEIVEKIRRGLHKSEAKLL